MACMVNHHRHYVARPPVARPAARQALLGDPENEACRPTPNTTRKTRDHGELFAAASVPCRYLPRRYGQCGAEIWRGLISRVANAVDKADRLPAVGGILNRAMHAINDGGPTTCRSALTLPSIFGLPFYLGASPLPLLLVGSENSSQNDHPLSLL